MAWCMRRWTCEPCRLFIVSRCVRIPCAAATSTASSVPVRAAPTCLTTRWCKFVSSGVCDLPPAHPPPPQRHVAQARGCKGAVRPGLLGRWPRCRRGGSWTRRTTPPAANWTAAGPSPRAATESRAPPDPHSRPQPSAETRDGPNARDLCMPSAAQLQMH